MEYLVLVFSPGIHFTLTGAGGTFLAYALMAIIVGNNQIAIAEVEVTMPNSSVTVIYLQHFVDSALRFAYGCI